MTETISEIAVTLSFVRISVLVRVQWEACGERDWRVDTGLRSTSGPAVSQGRYRFAAGRLHDADRDKGLVVATDFRGANIGKQFGWVGRSPLVYA